jgi:bifunctional non-homologous end joining protein LigD
VLPEIQPAKLARSLEPFDDADWIFELKHDGFRSLAYLENGHCRLVSRRRNTYKSFEVLREALSGLRAQSAILDGEIVCLDSNGVSQFKELLYRRGRAVLFAFDLVWLDGVDHAKLHSLNARKSCKDLSSAANARKSFIPNMSSETGSFYFRRFVSGILRGLSANGRWASTRSMDG